MPLNIHVIAYGDGWAVVPTGTGDRTYFRTEEQAIAAGTDRAKKEEVQLWIHGPDGQARERKSFGHKPGNVMV
ncbi:DUF2188 domain-containing protein [Cupriavidus plantarum]|uniref:Uncharacterized protein DUF2188 n=1 Tax=Cupriavidus plantarum TaxID=942865 RepID=A0A316F015_9BURK|nr:DUF2188 domain-containing protein [Cupriavidus plantarum]PWK36803.1 uncharacterized protein DUF2188 [Cupriavidus plantarum]